MVQTSATQSAFEYPPLFWSADQTAIRGERRGFRLLSLQLIALTAAAAAEPFEFHVGRYQAASAISGLLFVAALVLGLRHGATKPERSWYLGRAVAESVKSLSWLFAVGGRPFPLSDQAVAEAFEARLQSLRAQFEPLEVEGVGLPQIMPSMIELRSAALPARVAAYGLNRIDDQIAWYSSKAARNEQLGRRWGGAVFAVSALGVVGATLETIGVLSIGGLGFLAAIAAAFSAWTQARQNRVLASSYALAASELVSARVGTASASSEEEWARLVGDAEGAISREHATWVARASAMDLRAT